jgi:hypothetical protein
MTASAVPPRSSRSSKLAPVQRVADADGVQARRDRRETPSVRQLIEAALARAGKTVDLHDIRDAVLPLLTRAQLEKRVKDGLYQEVSSVHRSIRVAPLGGTSPRTTSARRETVRASQESGGFDAALDRILNGYWNTAAGQKRLASCTIAEDLPFIARAYRSSSASDAKIAQGFELLQKLGAKQRGARLVSDLPGDLIKEAYPS